MGHPFGSIIVLMTLLIGSAGAQDRPAETTVSASPQERPPGAPVPDLVDIAYGSHPRHVLDLYKVRLNVEAVVRGALQKAILRR